MSPAKPAIYVRISDDREGEAKGVKRQLEDCRALVKQRGWPVAVEYNDNDVSAWKRGVVRPAYQQLLADLTDGMVDGVVVYDLDRLCRQPVELEEFARICDDAGVTELAAVTGDVALTSGDGLLMARIKGAVAAKESDDKSRRIRRKALELAQEGKIGGGGTRPFGFESDRKTIRADEAAVVAEAAQRVLAGEAVRSICFDLNDRGVKTVTGKAWAPQVLTRMLKSGRISGQREHRGEIVADAEWPGVISKEDSARLRAVLSDPSRRKTGRARRYLLAGMLRCGRCGEGLQSRPREDGRRRYVCAKRPDAPDACGHLAVVADELEELIVEMVLYRLEGPELARAMAAQNGDQEDVHQRAVDAATTQLQELAAVYAEGNITVAEWMAARAPIEERLEAAKKALARSNGTSAVSEFVGTSALRERWDSLPLSRKRAILSAVLDHVTIHAGRRGFNRFDPERVAPHWHV